MPPASTPIGVGPNASAPATSIAVPSPPSVSTRSNSAPRAARDLRRVSRTLGAHHLARGAGRDDRRLGAADEALPAARRRVRDEEDARRQNDQERKSDTPHCCGVATNPRTLPVAPQRSALAAGSRPARSES